MSVEKTMVAFVPTPRLIHWTDLLGSKAVLFVVTVFAYLLSGHMTDWDCTRYNRWPSYKMGSDHKLTKSHKSNLQKFWGLHIKLLKIIACQVVARKYVLLDFGGFLCRQTVVVCTELQVQTAQYRSQIMRCFRTPIKFCLQSFDSSFKKLKIYFLSPSNKVNRTISQCKQKGDLLPV